jgi:hypothetical protein
MSSSFDNRKLRTEPRLTERKNWAREIESSCYSKNEKGKSLERFDCETENDNSGQRIGGISVDWNGCGNSILGCS